MDKPDQSAVDPLTLAFHVSAVDHVQEGVYFVDASRRIVYWNHAAESVSGYSSRLVVGRRCYDGLLRHVNDRGTELCHSACPLAQTIADGETREADVFLFHKDGYRKPVHVKTVAVRDPQGSVAGAVEVFSDSSASLASKAGIEDPAGLALVDTLTGIGNQRYLATALRKKVDEARRSGGRIGVMFIAVDHLEQVADTHGRAVADNLLKVAAKTISENARFLDIVGRWGNDEFMLVAPSVSLRMLDAIAERQRALLGRSAVPLADGEVTFTVSVGGVVSEGKTPAKALLEMAHRTMREARNAGHGRIVLTPVP